MSIIHFAAADALQTKVIEAGIYPSEVTNIDGPKKSGSGKSTNVFVDISVADGQYKDKKVTIAFSTGTQSAGPLGSMYWFPMASLLELHSAITGRKVVPEEFALDTDELMNKPFDAQWCIVTNEGIMSNSVSAFHPSGYGASAPSF